MRTPRFCAGTHPPLFTPKGPYRARREELGIAEIRPLYFGSFDINHIRPIYMSRLLCINTSIHYMAAIGIVRLRRQFSYYATTITHHASYTP